MNVSGVIFSPLEPKKQRSKKKKNPDLRLALFPKSTHQNSALFPPLLKCLQFWCDNLSVVSIINSGHSKTPRIMDLVRRLVLLSMQHNFIVRADHVPGVSNENTDALSRFQMQRFLALAPDTDQNPCTIPPSLMTL